MDEQSSLWQWLGFPQHCKRDGLIERDAVDPEFPRTGASGFEEDGVGRQVVHELDVHAELPNAEQNARPNALSAHALQFDGSPEHPGLDSFVSFWSVIPASPAARLATAFGRAGSCTEGELSKMESGSLSFDIICEIELGSPNPSWRHRQSTELVHIPHDRNWLAAPSSTMFGDMY